MQSYFYDLVAWVEAQLHSPEVVTCSFGAEDSDFVRFNHAAIRQAGRVTQRDMSIDLIQGRRNARGSTTLSGDLDEDKSRLQHVLRTLRDVLPDLPEDPHLEYATDVHSTEKHGQNDLLPASDLIPGILQAGHDTDMVGIYASGGIYHGFANSLGQRNWHSSHTYNLDWSLYHHDDKAVKCLYAGFQWQDAAYRQKMEGAREQLSLLGAPARTIDPGSYRIYLAPAAVAEVLWMVGATGFGLREHRTKRTCLLQMVEIDRKLHDLVHISEDTQHGTSPDFQDEGFIRPPHVSLIDQGCFRHCLTSPRSSREFGLAANGANESEQPESLDMAAGMLAQPQVLQAIDRGIYVNNLWYLNYSDPMACRMTGMTRFATFWVENGRIVAPLNVMRFDDTFYRMFGSNLLGLTQERDFIFVDLTYEGRSTVTARVPGALIDDVAFTL